MADIAQTDEDRAAQVEEAKKGLPLDLMTAVPGLNPRDMSVLIVGGLGKGVTLNAGVDNGDGTATLLEQDLKISGGLRMRFPPGASGPHSFAVTVISGDGHVRTGSLTVEPGLASLETGLRFSVEPPVVLDDSGRVGIPLAISFARGMGKMVGDVSLFLAGVPEGVHLTGGQRQEAQDGQSAGTATWSLKPDDVQDLNLIVPKGQDAFDIELTVDARGQSGGRIRFSRPARVVPPGARASAAPVPTRDAVPPPAKVAPGQAAQTPAGPGAPPPTDWLTGNGIFTFASGHGGDLFEYGYGWADGEAPPPPAGAEASGEPDGMVLRILAGGPSVDGPDPVVW
jgi:hypothetical protein